MEEFDCLRAIASFDHCKARLAQHLLYSQSKRRFIFDKKYRALSRSVQLLLLICDIVAGKANRIALRR